MRHVRRPTRWTTARRFSSRSGARAKRHVVSKALRAIRPHARRRDVRGKKMVDARVRIRARRTRARAHIAPTGTRRTSRCATSPSAVRAIVASSRVFAAYTASLARLANARSDRDAPSRTNKSPSVTRASVSAASRVAPPARHASDRRREAPRGSSPQTPRRSSLGRPRGER